MIVEIDKSLIYKWKSNTGKILTEKWILGKICGESTTIFVFVENRNIQTMKAILETYGVTGTIIYAHCWRLMFLFVLNLSSQQNNQKL